MASKRIRSGVQSNRAVPIPTTGIPSDQCLLLSGKVCDLVTHLLFFLNAYIAVERLISPEYADEGHVGVVPSRDELGALLNVLNNELRRRFEALAEITTVLHAQAAIDAAQAR